MDTKKFPCRRYKEGDLVMEETSVPELNENDVLIRIFIYHLILLTEDG
jgi:hypothetical protein